MKTTRTIILALALCLALTGTALAMNHGKAPDLTPEKQAIVDKAHDDYASATAGLKKQIFAKESALNAELYADKADDTKITALVGEINALYGKIYAEKVTMQRVLAKEGILPDMGKGMGHGMMGGGGCPMMSGGGGMGGGMMGGGMMGGGMKHGQAKGAPAAPAEAEGHSGHDATKQ